MEKSIFLRFIFLGVLSTFVLSCSTGPDMELVQWSPSKSDSGKEKNDASAQAKADEYYNSGKFDKAGKLYSRLLESDPQNAYLRFRLGGVYSKQGLIKKSCSEFLQAISIDPAYAKAHYNLGVLYSSKEPVYDVEKAVYFFKKYVEFAPPSENRKKIEGWLAQQEKFHWKKEEEVPKRLGIIKDGIKVYRDASLDSEVIARLAKGGSGRVLDQVKSVKSGAYFFKIKLKSGRTGWVHELDNK